MDFIKNLRDKARAAGKTIVLCEGEDKRVVEAASSAVKLGIAKIILLGNKEEIEKFGLTWMALRLWIRFQTLMPTGMRRFFLKPGKAR